MILSPILNESILDCLIIEKNDKRVKQTIPIVSLFYFSFPGVWKNKIILILFWKRIQAWQIKTGLLTYFLPDKKENEENIPAKQKKEKEKSWFPGQNAD